jgi:hypothetical protein
LENPNDVLFLIYGNFFHVDRTTGGSDVYDDLGDCSALPVVGQGILQSKGVGKITYLSISDAGTLVNAVFL